MLLGAATSFLLLNTLAVVFGAGIAEWLPERVTATLVALLFGAFGLHALLARGSDEVELRPDLAGHGVFFTTLSLIFLAELGDKTQLAVAGLASSMAALPVWLGASAALIMVSAVGVWIGHRLLRRVSRDWLHRLSGTLFLAFAVLAGWRAIA